MLDRLKIIPAEKVVTFEEPNQDRVAKTTNNLIRENKLHNPLLVTHHEESYLLLDDISIFSALKKIGVYHIPVQLADEGNLSVRPWQRVVNDLTGGDVKKFGELFPRKIRCRENESGKLLPNQADIVFRDKKSFRLTFLSDSFGTKTDLYIKFARAFMTGAAGFRGKLNRNATDLFTDFPLAAAAIFPPRLSFDDLIELSRRRLILPNGLVRVDQPGRIFGIDYSLAVLKEAAPVEEKQAFLTELIKMRMVNNRTAYYDGHVYVFNC